MSEKRWLIYRPKGHPHDGCWRLRALHHDSPREDASSYETMWLVPASALAAAEEQKAGDENAVFLAMRKAERVEGTLRELTEALRVVIPRLTKHQTDDPVEFVLATARCLSEPAPKDTPGAVRLATPPRPSGTVSSALPEPAPGDTDV